jgi:hypothetical protein
MIMNASIALNNIKQHRQMIKSLILISRHLEDLHYPEDRSVLLVEPFDEVEEPK